MKMDGFRVESSRGPGRGCRTHSRGAARWSRLKRGRVSRTGGAPRRWLYACSPSRPTRPAPLCLFRSVPPRHNGRLYWRAKAADGGDRGVRCRLLDGGRSQGAGQTPCAPAAGPQPDHRQPSCADHQRPYRSLASPRVGTRLRGGMRPGRHVGYHGPQRPERLRAWSLAISRAVGARHAQALARPLSARVPRRRHSEQRSFDPTALPATER